MEKDNLKDEPAISSNGVLVAWHDEKDPIKLRLLFLKRYCSDNVDMYKTWSEKPRCKHFKDKADAYYDISLQIETLIKEIEAGNVKMPCH